MTLLKLLACIQNTFNTNSTIQTVISFAGLYFSVYFLGGVGRKLREARGVFGMVGEGKENGKAHQTQSPALVTHITLVFEQGTGSGGRV